MSARSLPIASHEGETRALDDALRRWVLARTGSPMLADAAREASQAESQGHACADLAAWEPARYEALRAHPWVGSGDGITPFVLDAARRFYLWRNWSHEARLAEALLSRAGRTFIDVPETVLAADVAALFAGTPADATRRQREAVATVPGTRLFVLTGGPGTGKTTTVLRMLLMLLRHARAIGWTDTPSIALAAPTGKAAQRLAQAIAQGKSALRQNLRDLDVIALLDAIAHEQARTLHRLLGFDPRRDGFARNARQPLPADIVVVDEASMVDLALMRALTDALKPDALLILLGDPDQLASVDAGSVLADIVAGSRIDGASHDPAMDEAHRRPGQAASHADAVIASAPPAECTNQPSPLQRNVCRLTHAWRAQGGLSSWVDAVRTGNEQLPQRLAANGTDGPLIQRPCTDRTTLEARLREWVARHRDTFVRLFDPRIEPIQALYLLTRMQVLCAVREGTFGVQGVNAALARQLASLGGFDPARDWYHGRPVIVTRNDYTHGLFNGDVGITLRDGGGLRIWFPGHGNDGTEAVRSFSPRALPAHETAWAITVHRSQGSEYDEVALLLPPDPMHRSLSRELLYTAVSRARERAELWCSGDVLDSTLSHHVQRLGGLMERLCRGRPSYDVKHA